MAASPAPAVDPSSVAAEQLQSIVARIERLEDEKAGIAGDIKDVYAEAKSNGFDVKVLREIVRLRKQDHAERQEHDAIRDLYMQALGMLADTPLGRAAVQREASQHVGQKVARAFAGMEGVTVSLSRNAGPVMREAAKMMREAGAQVDLEDAIAARG